MFTSEIMSLAHQMKKADTNLTWSDCCRLAIKKARLQAEMRKGTISICFVKKSNGELRTAKATVLNAPETKGTGVPSGTFIIKFVDSDINEWRSCDVRTLTA